VRDLILFFVSVRFPCILHIPV